MSKPYVRGTPQEPLSFKWRLIIVSLLVLVSAGLATVISHADSPQNVNANAVYMSAVLAAAGAMACMTAFIYDSTMHALVLEVVVFGAAFFSETHSDVPKALAVAARSSAPVIAVALLSMLVPAFFGILFSMLNPLVISSLATIPVLSFALVYVLAVKSGNVTLSTTLIGGLGLAVIFLVVMWYCNRAHKHLNLLDKREMGIAFMTAMALMLSIQPATPALLLPALLGSTVCTLMCTVLAATADVWNTVGSNQFWMVSLDMAALVLYAAVPATILTWRLWSFYGSVLYGALHDVAQIVPGEPVDPTLSLLLLLATASTIGVFYTRSLCPLGAHLFGRVYCCGMQNTKKVAVCMDWSDGKLLLQDFKRLEVLLNFVVTAENLRCESDALQEAVLAGHCLLPYTGERKAHAEYENIFGRTPDWAHGETYPADILACARNGTKIALWSSYCCNSVNMEQLMADMEAALGGSIICLEHVPNVVELVEELTTEGYTVAPLSQVVTEYKMVLSVEHNG